MVGKADGEVVDAGRARGGRRSVYLQVRRSQPVTILQVFDQPVIETNCTRRSTSTVSSQALTLLNSDFLIRQAEAFAARRAAGRARATRRGTRCAWPSAGRRPRASKRLVPRLPGRARRRRAAADATPALADLCQMLLSATSSRTSIEPIRAGGRTDATSPP